MLFFGDRPDEVERLRDALGVAGFDANGVGAVLGPNGFALLARNDTGPLLRRTAGGSPLETLIRLFLCGVAVPRADAERACGGLSLDALQAAEIVAVHGDAVTGRLTLTPTIHDGDEWLVPADAGRAGERPPNYVAGVGPASMTLAGLTVRHPVRRGLDLGTGSGVQALFASGHAAQVVATDRNARAVALARFATRLNGVANIDVREGDLFDPVAAERFDLIVSNPPFVISPGQAFIYRDSGLAGDEICRRIVTEAPAYLEDGGWCQLLANWAHLRDQHWQDRVAQWLDGIACDAWVVQSRVEDAETYAANWIRHDRPHGDSAEVFDEWMRHYDQIGLEAVGFGLITLRRSDRATPWLCLEELAREFALPCGDEIAARFDRAVWLDEQAREDDALLASRLVVHYDVSRRDASYAAEGTWYRDQTVIELQHGLRYRTTVDDLGAQLIAGCDGTTSVADLIADMAQTVGIDAADIAPHVLSAVRDFVAKGFVRPVA